LFKGFGGLFDKGGDLPAGKWGVAGENVPEIIRGPASITSRRDTARAMQSPSGGGNISVDVQVGVQNGELVPLVASVAGQVAGQQLKAYNRNFPKRIQSAQARAT
jgi:hypothetical protein